MMLHNFSPRASKLIQYNDSWMITGLKSLEHWWLLVTTLWEVISRKGRRFEFWNCLTSRSLKEVCGLTVVYLSACLPLVPLLPHLVINRDILEKHHNSLGLYLPTRKTDSRMPYPLRKSSPWNNIFQTTYSHCWKYPNLLQGVLLW